MPRVLLSGVTCTVSLAMETENKMQKNKHGKTWQQDYPVGKPGA